MGYTHYWNQSRDFTREDWTQIREDMEALMRDVQHVQGIPLASGTGEPDNCFRVVGDNGFWFRFYLLHLYGRLRTYCDWP